MPTSSPLLHVGDTVRTVFVIDQGAIVLGLLVFAVATAWIWRDEVVRALGPALERRFRQRALSVAAAALVLLAVAPTIFPYEHVLAVGHADGYDLVHAIHCHDSTPGDCAEAPVGSGPGQFISTDPLIVVPVMLAVIVIVATPVWTGINSRPLTRPPSTLLAA
jgi:hypothetical protein